MLEEDWKKINQSVHNGCLRMVVSWSNLFSFIFLFLYFIESICFTFIIFGGIKQTFHDIIYRNMHISVLVEMAFTYQELAALYLFLFTC